MNQIISAIYEKGILILETPLSISEGSKVEVVIVSKEQKSPPELLAEIAALPKESDEYFSNRDHDRILYGKDDEK